MGTNRTRNSTAVGANRGRNGWSDDKRWDDADQAWEDVENTWDNYKREYYVSTSGVNRSRNAAPAGTNRIRN